MAASDPDCWNHINLIPHSDEDEMEWNEIGQREMNREECEEYYRALNASQGFDIPYFPDTMAIGRIEPIPDALLKGSDAEMLFSYATLAIEDYNNKTRLKSEVVEIIKANMEGVSGIIYYITFTVKPANTPAHFPTTIFQSKVYDDIHEVVHIEVCRPKQDGGNPTEGNDGGYCC